MLCSFERQPSWTYLRLRQHQSNNLCLLLWTAELRAMVAFTDNDPFSSTLPSQGVNLGKRERDRSTVFELDIRLYQTTKLIQTLTRDRYKVVTKRQMVWYLSQIDNVGTYHMLC